MTKPSIIRRASDDPMPYGINFFLYSDPGVGKTPLLANHPKTLILDGDLGAESAAGTPAEIWPMTTWTDMDAAYDYLRHEDHGYEWVWFDGIGVGQGRLLTDIMEEKVKTHTHRKVWAADKAEYGENLFRFKQWVQHMTALPFHFGITSHPWRFEDFVTGEELIMPWIQGKNMPQTICGMMNVIGFLTIDADDEDKRILRTKPHNGYYARDKFGALGAGLINPTIAKLEAKIQAKVAEVRKGRPSAAPVKKAAAKKAVAPVKKAGPAKRPAPTKRSV